MARAFDIPNKRNKYGMKFYELCTHDGLVFSAEIYGGHGFNDVKNPGQAADIPSVSLTEFLSSKGTYITGTLRQDRKETPRKSSQRS